MPLEVCEVCFSSNQLVELQHNPSPVSFDKAHSKNSTKHNSNRCTLNPVMSKKIVR